MQFKTISQGYYQVFDDAGVYLGTVLREIVGLITGRKPLSEWRAFTPEGKVASMPYYKRKEAARHLLVNHA